MRKEFSESIEKLASANKDVIFVTGDLGYNAFENLREILGDRFINADVAEQNMVGLAAGLASRGFKVFCYSIAPFIVYRCLEQFRNDVCFHHLPVFLVGNGGGYGYGIMGSTHHALEDLAVLSSMPGNTCWIPAFNNEVNEVVKKIYSSGKPAYLRMNNSRNFDGMITTESSRKIIHNERPELTLISTGPVINHISDALSSLKKPCDLFSVLRLPFEMTAEIETSIRRTKNLMVVEEHGPTGGLSQQVAAEILKLKLPVTNFKAVTSNGYPGGLYGSQEFHQQQSGLDPASLLNSIQALTGS